MKSLTPNDYALANYYDMMATRQTPEYRKQALDVQKGIFDLGGDMNDRYQKNFDAVKKWDSDGATALGKSWNSTFFNPNENKSDVLHAIANEMTNSGATNVPMAIEQAIKNGRIKDAGADMGLGNLISRLLGRSTVNVLEASKLPNDYTSNIFNINGAR